MSKWSNIMPQDWLKYVNRQVKVTACGNQEYEGWVFSVDPVSTSVVLVTFQEQRGAFVRIVLGHAIQEVEILREGDEDVENRMKALLMPVGSQTFSTKELEQRKESLRSWLEKNLVPVMVEGDVLRVANVLTISAPYGPEQCTSSNEIILARVQNLVESKPGPGSQQ